MGLTISRLEANGNIYTDVYVKIDNLSFENKAPFKLATYNIGFYPEKWSTNKIKDIRNVISQVDTGEDLLKKCYLNLTMQVAQAKARIVSVQSEITAIQNDETKRMLLVRRLKQLEEDPILQLDGAVSDEVSA